MSRAIDVRDVFRIHRTAEGDAAALQGLTLSVEEGEIVVVLGPSGAGKSTLLRILAALEPLSAGTANVYGLDIGSLRGRAAADYRARRLGMIDQHYTRALPPDLRCEEIIGLQLALRGEQRSQRRDRAAELLAAVGLERAAAMLPGQLSGGEQQRVAVCAALAHRPQLLLADEPSGELDRRNGDTVYELIRELARDQGTTAVIVSHDHGATRIADRTVRIRDGRLSEEWRDGRRDAGGRARRLGAPAGAPPCRPRHHVARPGRPGGRRRGAAAGAGHVRAAGAAGAAGRPRPRDRSRWRPCGR